MGVSFIIREGTMKRALKIFALLVVVIASLSLLAIFTNDADASGDNYLDYSITVRDCENVKSVYFEINYSQTDLELESAEWNPKLVDSAALYRVIPADNCGVIAFLDYTDIIGGEPLVFLHFKLSGDDDHPTVNFHVEFKNGTEQSPDDVLYEEGQAFEGVATFFGDKTAIQGMSTKSGSSVTVPYSVYENDVLLYRYSLRFTATNNHMDLAGANVFGEAHLFVPNLVMVNGAINTVDAVADRAFDGVSNLKEIALSEGLKTIGVYSFSRTGLESISIPATLQSIARYAFNGCESLQSITTAENERANSEGYCLRTIDGFAFMGCTNLRSVALPFATLTELSGNPFYNSEELEQISSVNGNGTLRVTDNQVYCVNTLVIAVASSDTYTVPSYVTEISPRAFMACKNLRTVIIQNEGILNIDSEAFDGTGLTSITISGPVGVIGQNAFRGNNLETITLTGVTELSKGAFSNNPNLREVAFNDSTAVIYQEAFSGSPVTSIGCNGNSSVTLNSKVFSGSEVTELSIIGPFTLGERSIGSMSALRTVTMSGIMNINQKAFTGSDNIEAFVIQGNDTDYSSDSGVILEDGMVYVVPSKLKNAVFTVPISGLYADAFKGHTNLVQVTFPVNSTLTTIPGGAFEGCTSLVAINIPDSVGAIGNDAFKGCSNLSEVSIADSSLLLSLGNSAFSGTSLMSVVLPADLKSIGDSCFEGCLSLVEVSFNGNSLESIGSRAFYETGLRAIEIPGSVQEISPTSFGSCPNLSNILFGQGSSYQFDGNAVYRGDRLVFVLPTVRSYSLPSTVSSIESDAFDIAVDLTEIVCAGNANYASYGGILFDKECSRIVAIPLVIKEVRIPNTITQLNGSVFSNSKEIELFYWEAPSIELVQNSNLVADKVVFVSSGTITLGMFAINDSSEVLLIADGSIALGTRSIRGADLVYLNSTDATVESTSITTDKLCICPGNGVAYSTYLQKFNSLTRYSTLYLPSETMECDNDKYSGVFEYDGTTYSITTPFSYVQDTSIFVDNSLDLVAVSDVGINSDTLSFRLNNIESVVGDVAVYVDGNLIDVGAEGSFEHHLADGVRKIHISIQLLSSDILHDVSFDLMGGEGIGTVKVQHGGTLKALQLSIPTKSGYTFDGWYSDPSFTQSFDLTNKILSDTQLYAKWTYNDGKYLVNVLSHSEAVQLIKDNQPVAFGELVDGGSIVNVSYCDSLSWECIGWRINGVDSWSIGIQLTLDRDYYIEPLLRYTSPSNVLTDVVDVKTPEYGQDVVLQWSKQYKIDASMSVWSGFPSTPVIMDNAVYVRAGTTLYKYDADTGELLATAESRMLVSYYLYLGVGGGMVYDYATHIVYDADLVKQYDSPKEFTAVFYDSGYFYGLSGGKIYKMEASTGSLVSNGQWANGVGCTWFGMYGTTSAPVFADGHMFFIEALTNSDYRGLASVDLTTGSKTTIELTSQSGRLLDDGWLSCDTKDGRAILFMTAYSQGLFDNGTFRNATITAVVVNSDGTLSDQCPIVDIEFNSSTLSKLVIFNGRGYVNGTHLHVLDMNKLETMVLNCSSGVTSVNATSLESEYLIYKDPSVSTHGSIVVSSGYYSTTGKIYVYILPYNPPNAVYIFEDYEGKTEPTGYFVTSKTGSQYSSQAVRVTLKGNLVWYLDSGTVYCYGTPEANPYSFQITVGDESYTIAGNGKTALDAFRDALNKSRIQNTVSSSGNIIEIAGTEGNWAIDSYYDGKWNSVISIASKSNDMHHIYRICLRSDAPVKEEVAFDVNPVVLDLVINTSGKVGTVTVSGNIPDGVIFTWEALDDDVVSILVSSDSRTVTVTALSIGSTTINVYLSGDMYFGQSQFTVSVTEDLGPKVYVFTLRMVEDADKADYGESGYSASDLRNGITLTATGSNAGEALETALTNAKVPCNFWTKEDNTIRYWVDDIFGLGDVKMDGGLWKYWIQYQIVDGQESYNQWSLGFYNGGGEFHLTYGITEESGQVVHPSDEEPEIPEQYDNSGSQTSIVDVITNDDGSTTVIADSTYVIDGTQTTAEITTKDNGDGTTTVTEKTTVTNPDGSSSVTVSETVVSDDGTQTTTATVTNSDGSTSTITSETTVSEGVATTTSNTTNSDGTSSETTSTVEQTANGTVTTSTETTKDASGNVTQTVESLVTVSDTVADGVRTTVTESDSKVTDASGNVTQVSTTETAVKQSDGSSVVIRTTETTADGKTTTEMSAGAISADGKVHTVADTSATETTEVITKVKADGDDGSCTISNDSVQKAIGQQNTISDAFGDTVDTTKIIEVTSTVQEVSASLEKESLGDMSENDVILKMTSTQGSMTFGKDVLSSMSDKDDVTLSFAIADRSSMTSAQREVIEVGSTVVNLTATSAGQSVGKDLGGKVIVTVKHVAVDGKTPVAYYVDENGNRTKVAEQSYDAEKGEMTMILDHFSLYTIVDESPAGEGLPVAVLVMTAIIVLICLGILLPQVVGRKQ